MAQESTAAPVTAFAWECQPEAAAIVGSLLDEFCQRSPAARTLQERMLCETGTRLIDWIDFLAVRRDQADRSTLAAAGFSLRTDDDGPVAEHTGGMFPRLRLDAPIMALGVKVESVADFLRANGLKSVAIDGAAWAPLRMARIAGEADAELWVVERHGDTGFAPRAVTADEVALVLQHEEAFRCRRRRFDRDADGFDHALALIETAKRDLGMNRTCAMFFRAERDYWMSRNRAARMQKSRQDRLGLGWGNHDHHTYRSSREHFTRLIDVMEALGMKCRERFYAGLEAGWGAQVLEQPACGVMVFADVDLSPEEVTGDFAHQHLLPRDAVGTVGLWCKLHGEALLEAGMHHLEAQFDFHAAREQLASLGIATMAPFTDFEFLKQAFTEAEVWPVEPRRLAIAHAAGYLTDRQADEFARCGAVGSHLEILERNQGYKGFNQTGISQIIRRTDPRGQSLGA